MVTTEDREIELECVSENGKPAAEVFIKLPLKFIEYLYVNVPDAHFHTYKHIKKCLLPKIWR